MTTWRRAALAPARLDLRLRPGPSAAAALSIYGPLRVGATAAAHVNRSLLSVGLWRSTDEPLAGVDDLARLVSVSPDAVATMASSTPGRLIVGFAAEGTLRVVAKVGTRDDHGLKREATFLASLNGRGPRDFAVPTLRWAGDWHDRYVVAVDGHAAVAPVTITDAVQVAVALSSAVVGGTTTTHGDFAPWNLVRTASGLLLRDWEDARTPCEAMVDLTHFVLQSGSLLGTMNPDEAIRTLTSPGNAGCQYLEAIGRHPRTAHDLVAAALSVDAPGRRDPRTLKFRNAMWRSLRPASIAS